MSNDKLAATFSGGGEDNPAPAKPVRGMEIDLRPHPALREDAGETRNLTEIARLIEAERASQTDWPTGHTTGAFVSAAASIRHEVKPYRWHEVSLSILGLYGLFIGLPAAGLAWAVWEIVHRS